ncbi:hypothetical protein BDB01DRAFT_804993 [Pilobolus umbonatus]|nr:hypothetical protein BDB01DRAFT_804993 [Pilobolus umbonatus]
MHSLPSELQSLIIGQLHKPDYLECITVCKAWYTIFIPLIYESMIIQDNEFMIPFLESMMTRPRCIDACQYIKKLDAIDLLERYTINEAPSRYKKKTINIDFMNMIANCHNV